MSNKPNSRQIYKENQFVQFLQTELLKMENTTEMKNSMDRLNSKLKTTERTLRVLNKILIISDKK